jgi:DNA-directed RNA polymerase specialized sigma54-like protein
MKTEELKVRTQEIKLELKLLTSQMTDYQNYVPQLVKENEILDLKLVGHRESIESYQKTCDTIKKERDLQKLLKKQEK